VSCRCAENAAEDEWDLREVGGPQLPGGPVPEAAAGPTHPGRQRRQSGGHGVSHVSRKEPLDPPAPDYNILYLSIGLGLGTGGSRWMSFSKANEFILNRVYLERVGIRF